MEWCIRQDSHLQTLRSKRRMIVISPRMRNGADGETCTLVGQCPAVYETAAVAAEPHRRENGLPSRGSRTRTNSEITILDLHLVSRSAVLRRRDRNRFSGTVRNVGLVQSSRTLHKP